MYEIDIVSFTVKREEIEQEFTLDDYNFKKELFMNDCIDFINAEVVTNISITIYHNRDIKHLEIKLDPYNWNTKTIFIKLT